MINITQPEAADAGAVAWRVRQIGTTLWALKHQKPNAAYDSGWEVQALYAFPTAAGTTSTPVDRDQAECPSCKMPFQNGGQCAAPVMRGGCPMGGDV